MDKDGTMPAFDELNKRQAQTWDFLDQIIWLAHMNNVADTYVENAAAELAKLRDELQTQQDVNLMAARELLTEHDKLRKSEVIFPCHG